MTVRITVSPADRAWWERSAFRNPASILRFAPREVAALSQSSETFAVRLADLPAVHASSAPAFGDAERPAPEVVFVKRYRYRTLLGRLQGAFRGTLLGRNRARFEYETLNAIRARGVAAVRPIAHVEFRKRGFVRSCVLITEAERDAQPLDQWLQRRRGVGDVVGMNRATRRRGSDQLAAFVARMHESGVVHGALLGRNVLASVGNGADAVRFVLLDPNPRGSVSVSPATQAGRISDLTDLAATALPFTTRTERTRFLRAYLTRRRFAKADRAMIAEIERGAIRLSTTEQHRQTIAAAILWLQDRIRRRSIPSSDRSLRRFQSLDEFLAAIDGATVSSIAPTTRAETTIRLKIAASTKGAPRAACAIDLRIVSATSVREQAASPAGTYAVCHCSVSCGSRGAVSPHVGTDHPRVAVADLQIACDEATFLAAINGDVEALERARRGRIEVRGDTTLLDVLGSLADAPCASAERRA